MENIFKKSLAIITSVVMVSELNASEYIIAFDESDKESTLTITDKQFKKLQSKLAYLYYAINANNAIALERDRSKWYTNIKYRKSIITIKENE